MNSKSRFVIKGTLAVGLILCVALVASSNRGKSSAQPGPGTVTTYTKLALPDGGKFVSGGVTHVRPSPTWLERTWFDVKNGSGLELELQVTPHTIIAETDKPLAARSW